MSSLNVIVLTVNQKGKKGWYAAYQLNGKFKTKDFDRQVSKEEAKEAILAELSKKPVDTPTMDVTASDAEIKSQQRRKTASDTAKGDSGQ